MKITAIEARHYRIPLDPPFPAAWDPRPRDRIEETLVVVDTDIGVRGFAGGAPVPDIGVLESLLIGVDLTQGDLVHTICTQVDFHHGRNWTVELAVADALARARDEPLWKMLGGERRSFPAYASTGERLEPEARVERTQGWASEGIGAIKLRFNQEDWQKDVAVVAAVREALGDQVEIMVDTNHGWRLPGDRTQPWDLATALDCAHALAELDVYWLEEPLPTSAIEDYVRLRELSDVRIAGGEMVRSLAETRRLVMSGAFDVVQNDVVLAGGLVGAIKVSQWAAEAGVVWSPHTWTTGLGLVANLHAALALSTAEFIEVPYDPPAWTPERRDFVLPEPLLISGDGTIAAPDGPGLGVEPDLEALERYRVG